MSAKKYLKDIAQALGMGLDVNTETIYGEREGYALTLRPLGQAAQFNITAAVRRGTEHAVRESLLPFVKGSAFLADAAVNGAYVVFSTKGAMSGKKTRENAVAAVAEITSFLRTNGFESCCPVCAEVKHTEACCVQGTVHLMCDACFQNASVSAETARQTHTEKRENVFAGLVGALLGALLGAASIVLIGQLGYISAISGIIMGVCTLKGYELLAKKLSLKGIVMSCVLMVLMIFLGNQVDWAISIAVELEVDFATAFRFVLPLFTEGYLDSGVFIQNLVMMYVFSALGVVPTVLSTVRQRRSAFTTYRLAAGNAMPMPTAVPAAPVQREAEGGDTPWEK